MKNLAVSKQFQSQLKKLPPQEREKAAMTLKGFLLALREGKIPQGYGFKKINGDKYEICAGLRVRIVMKAEGDTLICHLIGNHDGVHRYLREYRNR